MSQPAHHTLYELNTAYLDALNNIEIDENGEVIGGEHLELIKEERDQKIQNYAHMFLIWKTEIEAVEAEKKRIESIRKSLDRKMEWAKNTLAHIVMPGAKIGRVSWRKSEALEISADAIENIPEQFIIHEITPIKSAIQRAIKDGAEIPGCEIVTRQNIQIK